MALLKEKFMLVLLEWYKKVSSFVIKYPFSFAGILAGFCQKLGFLLSPSLCALYIEA